MSTIHTSDTQATLASPTLRQRPPPATPAASSSREGDDSLYALVPRLSATFGLDADGDFTHRDRDARSSRMSRNSERSDNDLEDAVMDRQRKISYLEVRTCTALTHTVRIFSHTRTTHRLIIERSVPCSLSTSLNERCATSLTRPF